ncbi:MAG: NYN domain-containing protein [Magnetococcales bacterium]|nr:NYN domain-containing protein [Magnetococcales bacterium]
MQINKIACAAHPFSLLYRCFYYNARPYVKKGHLPISHRAIDYAKSDEASFRLSLFDLLRRRANFAVRLGEVRRERGWILSEQAQKDLLERKRTVDSLADTDFIPGFRQKAVDMRIGVDITSISLKKQADTIILVAGDSDFVPAAKLARREGVRIILDPMWRSVESALFEHIDGLRSGFPRPKGADVDGMDVC